MIVEKVANKKTVKKWISKDKELKLIQSVEELANILFTDFIK